MEVTIYICRQILVHANRNGSCMSQAMFVIVQWPFSRSSDLQLEDSKATVHRLVHLNHICVCFRAWLLAVCVLVKVSQGSQNLGALAFWATTSLLCTSSCNVGRLACHPWRLVPELFFHQKLGREISPLLALCRLISNTDKQGSTVLHGKNVKTSLAQIPSAALKWHSENCPSSCWLSKRSFGRVTTSPCQGRFWKPMEVTTFADKFGYTLTRTGATCLKLCWAEDSSVTLFKVKWPPTRRFKGHLASLTNTACLLY